MIKIYLRTLSMATFGTALAQGAKPSSIEPIA
jgi:hypothetical protein